MPVKRGVTLKDISERVGVNPTAVSTVLNGNRSSSRVSQATRQRVLDAARELGYRPNAIARSLRQQSTDIIGFYSGYGNLYTLDPFNAEIILGLQKGTEAADKDLLMHGSVRGRSADAIYRELLNGKIDGLVLLSPPNNPLVALLSESSLPVVAIVDAVPALPSVVANDAAGSHMIAQYLADKGHRRVLYRKSALKTASDLRRLDAFCEASASHGITVVEIVETYWHDGLYEEEKIWLASSVDRRPTAIVCWNDGAAYRAVEACLGIGLRVPEDIAVIGFDGFQWPQTLAHQLTTVRASWPDVARTAVELLVARLGGEEIPLETVLPVELVIGETA